MNGFNKQNKEGKKAESAIYSLLLERGNKVEDVSSIKEYQEIDVDFLVNDTIKMEVKLDNSAKRTGNIFLEVGKDRATGYFAQWLSKCQADVIVFYDSDRGLAEFYNFNMLKELAKRYPTRDYWDKVDGCRTYFKAIPKSQAENSLILKV